MTPEGKIKVLINKMLVKHKAWYFMPVPTGFQATSVDYFVCCKGHFIAIEAKRPGKKLTTRQQFVFERIRGAGGLTFVIDNEEAVEDLDDLIGALRDTRS